LGRLAAYYPSKLSPQNENGTAPAFGPAPLFFPIVLEYQIEEGNLDIFRTLYWLANQQLATNHLEKALDKNFV